MQALQKNALTIIVNSEWNVGRDDVIEADLAILRGAVSIHRFYPHNAIIQTTLGHRCLISTLHKDRRELVHIIHTNVHRGPGNTSNLESKTHAYRRTIPNTYCIHFYINIVRLTCGISCCWRHQHPHRSHKPGWWSYALFDFHNPEALLTEPDLLQWSGPTPQPQTVQNRNHSDHYEP